MGTLNAIGGVSCAAIGGGLTTAGSNITINGGIVNAQAGSWGAGIGGGGKAQGSNIVINGGYVTAQSEDGAAIGGGSDADGTNITINGGHVSASSGLANGIGGGVKGNASNIRINGGSVFATGAANASGIGADGNGTATGIYVADQIVLKADTATDPPATLVAHASIATDLASDLDGKSYVTAVGPPIEVVSYLSPVYKTAGVAASGILLWDTLQCVAYTSVESDQSSWGTAGTDSWYVLNSDISITNSMLTCDGNVHLILTNGHTLTIEGRSESYYSFPAIFVSGSNSLTIYAQDTAHGIMGTLNATSGVYSAGIGGLQEYAGTNITINGGNINASSSELGAGIGGGQGASGDTITINGGYVSAHSNYGTGIGGGLGGGAREITINGGHVVAVSDQACGIGGGSNGMVSNIRINGGNVITTGGGEGEGIGTVEVPLYELPEQLRASAGTASNIFFEKKLVVKADTATNPPTTVIEHVHSSTDMASTLNGKKYVTVTEPTEGVMYLAPVYKTAGVVASGIDHWDTLECIDYTDVEADQTSWGIEGYDTWYVLFTDVTLADVVTCHGNVHLILETGYTLNATTIVVDGTGNSLTIYAQDTARNLMGRLVADASGTTSDAGIGGRNNGNGSNVTINGGMITATGGKYAAGIGGGQCGNCSNIAINGGVVTATGGSGAGAGIGSGHGTGFHGTCSDIVINGGSIVAYGNTAGIGAENASNFFVADCIQLQAGASASVATTVPHASIATDIATSVFIYKYASTTALPDYKVVLSGGKAYKNSTSGENITFAMAAKGLAYAGGKWTMSNFDFTTAADTALIVADRAVLNVVGTNTVASSDKGTGNAIGMAFKAGSSAITLATGATLTVDGGDAVHMTYGIVAEGNLTVSGKGTLVANAGDCTDEYFIIGMRVEDTLTVTNSNITATGGAPITSDPTIGSISVTLSAGLYAGTVLLYGTAHVVGIGGDGTAIVGAVLSNPPTNAYTATSTGNTVYWSHAGFYMYLSFANKALTTSASHIVMTPLPTIDGVTATGFSGMYDGAAHTLSVAGTQTGDVVVYSTDSLNWSTTAPTFTNATSSAVYAKVSRTGYFDLCLSDSVIISKRNVTLTSKNASRYYDGTPLVKNEVSVTGSGFVNDEGANYSFTGSQTNAGSSKNIFDYTLSGSTLAENYDIDTAYGTLEVFATNIASAAVAAIPNQTYTGYAIKPSLTITYNGKKLVEGTDYTAAYSDNVSAGGSATVQLTGIGNYTGSTAAFFYIDFAPIANATIATIADTTYCGAAIEPALVVTFGGDTLVAGADYTAAYSNNTNVGTATVQLTGMGNFSGNASTTFTIVAANIASANIATMADTTYSGSAIEPAPVVTFGGNTLVAGTDYTAAYSNNTAAGTATVQLTGMGNFTGNASATFTIVAASLTDVAVAAIPCQTYTGAAIEPALTITYHGLPLVKDTDYTAVYSSDTNVGTATAHLIGIGNFGGATTCYFTIVAASIADATIATIADATYCGAAIEPALVVTFGGDTLVAGTDYTAAYSSNTNVGTATVQLTGMGNFGGSASATFTIVAANIASANIATMADTTYSGSAIEPAPVVTFGGNTLVAGTDYTAAYSNNTAAGTATVQLTGMGNFTGNASATFTIVAASLTDVAVAAIPNQTYTGAAIEPALTITYHGLPLVKDTDYTAVYSSDTNVGTATVQLTGIGNFGGATSATFSIVAASIADATIATIADATYCGAAIEPALIVTFGGDTLVAGTDYTAAYSSNTNVGTATVQLTGMGNFTGNASATFSIVAASLTDVAVAAIPNQTYTGAAIEPAPVVTFGGNTLVAGADYTAAYSNNTDVGTATVQLTGMGNFTGNASATFSIVVASLTDVAVAAIPNQTYTGAAIEPALTITYHGLPLVKDTDYTVAYSSDTNVGTATVQLNGMGNFGGTATCYFTIAAANILEAAIAAIPDQAYTGLAIEPALTITYGGLPLVKGTDYSVAYSNNVALGTASATISGMGNYTGTVSKDFVIAQNTFQITATANAAGLGTVTGSGRYAQYAYATLTATPAEHYRFEMWSNGSTTNPYVVYVEGDTTLTAIFVPNTKQLNALTNNTAMGTVVGGGTYDIGTTHTIVARPATGYHFAGWSNGAQDTVLSILLASDTTVVATFEIDQYQIDASANNSAWGTISGAGRYNYGDTVTLVAHSANSHLRFDGWYAQGSATPCATTATIGFRAYGDRALEARFSLDQHAVVAVANTAAMGTVSGAGIYSHGDTATLVATAAAHHHFTGWNNGSTNAALSVVVDTAISLTANFAIDQHTLAAVANDAALGTVEGAGTYNYGATVSLTATAAEHATFTGWSNGSTTRTITFTLTSDTLLTAQFAYASHTLTLAADAAMGSATGGGSYTYGTQAMITATANNCYHFAGWSDGATNNPRRVTIGSDSTIRAIFAADLYQGEFSHTACDSYSWNGKSYTATGSYQHRCTTAEGCDSIVTMHLVINHSNTGVDLQQQCDNYVWINGTTYTASNYTDQHTTTNHLGCDSVVTLVLTMHYSSCDTFAATATNSYTWDGQEYTATGLYTLTYSNVDGCDSIVALQLTVVELPAPVLDHIGGAVVMVSHYPAGSDYVDYFDYRWYRDGALIATGTDNYTEATGTLSGCYYVEVPADSTRTSWLRSEALCFGSEGIADVAEADIAFSVSPNPAQRGTQTVVSTTLDATALQGATLTLYDMRGRTVATMPMQQPTLALPTGSLSGLYMLRLTTATGRSAVQKLVVR